jgi:hypothetical protein
MANQQQSQEFAASAHGSFANQIFAQLSVEPVAYHGMGSKLRILTRPKNDLSGQFHAIGVNGDVPFVSFNSPANGVSNASILHSLTRVVLDARQGSI